MQQNRQDNLKDLLDNPPSDERTLDLVSALYEHIQETHQQVTNAGYKTPLHLFCTKNEVPIALASVTVKELNAYARANDGYLRNLSNQDDTRFSKPEAIEIVAAAFEKFDSRMAKCVRDAAREGRIGFGTTPTTSHQSRVHGKSPLTKQCKEMQKLPYTLEGKPYAWVAMRGDKVSLENLFALAHECGHLASEELCMQANGGNATLAENKPLAESFALMGEHILYDHLLSSVAGVPEARRRIETAYHEGIRLLMFNTAHTVQCEQTLIKDYEAILMAGDNPDQKNNAKAAFFKTAAKVIQGGDVNNMLLLTPTYDLSYPLAIMATQPIFRAWKEGVPGEAKRWVDAAQSGKKFFSVMDDMGVNLGPSLVRSSLSSYARQKANIDKLTWRAPIAVTRQLEEAQAEGWQGMPVALSDQAYTPITQVGAVMPSRALAQGKSGQAL